MPKPKMSYMKGSRKGLTPSRIRRSETGGAGLVTVALVVVSLVIFTLSVQENGTGVFSTVRDVTQTIVSPLKFVGSAVTSPLSGIGNIMRNLTADGETLSELKEENERLSARNVELEEAELTAKRLQELLDVKSSYNLQSIAARVISGPTDSWTSTVTIDKGSASGVSVGMPVVDQKGAIGQVLSCSATSATVRLLSDEGSAISAMLQTSRAQGMLRGSVDGTLHLQYIRTDQTVNAGDIVVTSGLGGVFPKGLPIGKVSSVESSPSSAYYDIVVEPFSRAENYEELLVITSLTEEQRATSEEISNADAADREAAAGKSVQSSSDEKAHSEDAANGETTEKGTGTESGSAKTGNTNSSEGVSGDSSQTSDASNGSGTDSEANTGGGAQGNANQ